MPTTRVRPTAADPASESPTMINSEVRELVARAQAGDAEAFGLIYDRYVDVVFRFVSRRVEVLQVAEDLTSETFLRALRNIGAFRWGGSDFGAWLMTIARHLIADHFKSGHHRFEVAMPLVRDKQVDLMSDPETATIDHFTSVDLWAKVQQLSPEQRECIVLRFLRGFSVAETAQVMGKREAAIKALQHRAVRTLARLLPAAAVMA